MPNYVCLLYGEPTTADYDEAEMSEAMAKHEVFMKRAVELGAKILGGEALQPVETATTIRNRPESDPLVIDGPFAETKEELGGFYLIEARDLDHALEVAKLIPEPTVEVRPVYPTP